MEIVYSSDHSTTQQVSENGDTNHSTDNGDVTMTTIEVQLEFGEEEEEDENGRVEESVVAKGNGVVENGGNLVNGQVKVAETGGVGLTTSCSSNKVPTIENEKKEKKSRQEDMQPKKSRLLGIMLAFIAAFMYSASSYTIKLLHFHAINLGIWRFIALIAITFPFVLHGGFCRKKKTSKPVENGGIIHDDNDEGIFKQIWPPNRTTGYLILQAIFGSNSIVLVFFGLTYLPLGDSAVICTSAPVFVTIAARIFLKEKCGVIPMILPIIALVGVGIICKPPLLTGETTINEDNIKGVVYSFTSMILLTVTYVLLRHLRKVHHSLIQLSFGIWGLLQMSLMGWLMDVIRPPQDEWETGMIIINAILAFTAQTCITLALKYEQAGVVALIRMAEVVFCYFWQALLLNVQADLYSVIGAIVTLFCVLVASLRKMVMSLDDNSKYKKYFRFLLY